MRDIEITSAYSNSDMTVDWPLLFLFYKEKYYYGLFVHGKADVAAKLTS